MEVSKHIPVTSSRFTLRIGALLASSVLSAGVCPWLVWGLCPAVVAAQDATSVAPSDSPTRPLTPETPEKVEVKPVAQDEEIQARLERIFRATGWFPEIDVRADQGIVFLSGTTDSEAHREWAERLAQKTSDVVAVVNQLTVPGGPFWDIQPAVDQLDDLSRGVTQLLPLLVIGMLIIIVARFLARLLGGATKRVAAKRVQSQLLQQMTSNIVAVLVTLLGVYIALRVSGLSRLAVTILGGTGLVGLALGFAFRDIAENYLASVLISLNRPFSVGDLIQIADSRGYVQRVTTRGTLLLTPDGNHVQIPNSTVYKSVITNYSASPKVRNEFLIDLASDWTVSDAQRVAMNVLQAHESVDAEPKPQVLLESVVGGVVKLRLLYWLDSKRFDASSVKSSLMRQVRSHLAEARQPESESVHMNEGNTSASASDAASKPGKGIHSSDKAARTHAEGNLKSHDDEVQEHAAPVSLPQMQENLIAKSPSVCVRRLGQRIHRGIPSYF